MSPVFSHTRTHTCVCVCFMPRLAEASFEKATGNFLLLSPQLSGVLLICSTSLMSRVQLSREVKRAEEVAKQF